MNLVPSNYILETAQCESVSKAAEKLNISQPALSAHIKKIEEHLGITIFDRSQKPLRLTDAGEIYIEYVKESMELDKKFMQQLSDLDELKTGRIVIGGASFFNVSYLPTAIAAYTKQYPGIHIEVIDGKMPEIIDKALKGEVDLFISPSWKEDEHFCYEPILSERIFICVPPNWPINKSLQEKRIPLELILEGDQERLSAWEKEHCLDFLELKNEPFILLKEDQHIGSIMARIFEKHGFQPEKFLSTEQTMTSYALTLAGVGISLMTESTIKNGQLKNYPALYITEPELCKRNMHVAYPKQRYLSRASKEFIVFLRQALGQ